MKDLNKRLVEVETILKKLDENYINKIPTEIWDFIEKNKDDKYTFFYDDNIELSNQNLNIDTIAILSYINMEYLLDEKSKKEVEEILIKDGAFLEQQKMKKYNPENIFKNKENIENKGDIDVSMIEVKEKCKWYQKIISFFRKMWRK